MSAKNPTADRLLRDLRIALMLLTRLPLPAVDMQPEEEAATSSWAYPLAGVVLAALAGVLATVALWVGLPATVTAGLALAALIVTSGAMHEDGLADCADGFWGGWDSDRRLEIMRDSRIGAYGVVALILTQGLRWAAYAALFATGSVFGPLLVAAILSRTGMLYAMDILPNAREDGLSKTTGRPGKPNTRIAAGIAVAAALLFYGWSGLLPILAGLIAMTAVSRISMHKIGGQTGDVLGATQQITEIVVLLSLLATL